MTLETMQDVRKSYLPAAGHDLFLPLYDPLVKLLGGDRARRRLLDGAAVRPGHRVLELGCGTGSLVTLVKRLHPEADVVGLDPDPKALALARRKAQKAGVSIQLDRGFSNELPYPDASFDRAFSSFMFHHLEPADKEASLREVRRVLRPGGSLHLLDFGGPEDAGGRISRWIHSRHRLSENSSDRVLAAMRRAGFPDAKVQSRGSMRGLRIFYYRAG